jgi:hypothetical protein
VLVSGFGCLKNNVMSRIAIVDDNREQRESMRIKLSLFLKKKESTLQVIDIFPFQTFDEYYSWIESNEICLLIFDERLHESQGDNEPVAYRGNELVTKVRERFKDLPIFTVTAHIDDDELQAKFSEFDYIITRHDFDERYIDIMIRASQRYLTENQKELAEFDDLTKQVAVGSASSSSIERLRALQLKLHIPLSTDLKDREDWLKEYEKQIVLLNEIKGRLEQKLRKN